MTMRRSSQQKCRLACQDITIILCQYSFCRAKRQQLHTCKVSRCCPSARQGKMKQNTLFSSKVRQTRPFGTIREKEEMIKEVNEIWLNNNKSEKKSILIYHVTYILHTVLYLLIHTFLMYSVKQIMLCVIALFNIIKGVLLMTMGNWYLMHIRENSYLTIEFLNLVHSLVL